MSLSDLRRVAGRWRRQLLERKPPLGSITFATDADPLWWHRPLIEHFAHIFKPRLYVELGIFRCELFNRIVPHASHSIGVDIDPNAGAMMTKSDKTEFVCSPTDDFVQRLKARPLSIDMLFIDADHAKDAVLNDFWGLFPFVTPHGLIFLHDTHPKDKEAMQRHLCDDSYLAIPELARATDRLELMTLPLHPGLTICRKRKTQLSWMENEPDSLTK